MELGYIFLPHLLNKLRIIIQSEQAHKLQLLPVHFLKNKKQKKKKKKKQKKKNNKQKTKNTTKYLFGSFRQGRTQTGLRSHRN